MESFKFYLNVESYPGFSVQNKFGILSSRDTNKPVGELMSLLNTGNLRTSYMAKFAVIKVCRNSVSPSVVCSSHWTSFSTQGTHRRIRTRSVD